MAKVTITLEDRDDGSVDVWFEFDPEAPSEASGLRTSAQREAVSIADFLARDVEAVLTAEVNGERVDL